MAHIELSALPLKPTWTPNLGHTIAESWAQQFPAKSAIESARNQLIAEHLHMVHRLARRLHGRLPQHVDVEDLVSAGTLGLVDAASRYRAVNQLQFQSYAKRRIEGAMLDLLRTMDWGSRSLRRQERQVEQSIRVLAAKGISSPTSTEVANEMGLPLAQYQQLLSDITSVRLSSLQAECGQTGEQIVDFIPASPLEDPLIRCLQREMRSRLVRMTDTLPEKERLVLALYYSEELTMREISAVMGGVVSRVSQIHTTAIAHLKSAFASNVHTGPAHRNTLASEMYAGLSKS